MNLERRSNVDERNTPPWVFSVAVDFDPKSASDKDILSCAVYKRVSYTLTRQLFETQKLLCDSLQGGLSVQLYELTLEHFDLEGRFDRAVCNLHLTNRGPTRFWLETQFLRGVSIVTVLTQEGLLYFGELGL